MHLWSFYIIIYSVLKYCGNEEYLMSVSYKKLLKLLIDRDMKKKDLMEKAELSPTTISKLGNDKTVSMDVLMRICAALEVDFGDIMEFLPDKK